jgi:hypothetical protein
MSPHARGGPREESSSVASSSAQYWEGPRWLSWKGRLELIAAALGTAGLIQFIGGAVFYWRLRQAGVPEMHTVAELPRDLLFVEGARTMLPVVVGAVGAAVLAQFVGRAPAPASTPAPAANAAELRWRAEQRGPGGSLERSFSVFDLGEPAAANPRDEFPKRYWVAIGAVVFMCGVSIALVDPTSLQVALGLVATVVTALAVGMAIKLVDGVAQPPWIVFLAMLAFGVALVAIREVGEDLKLDVAAVELTTGERIGGFLIAQEDGDVRLAVEGRAPLPRDLTDRDVARQILVFRNDKVERFAYGPRGVGVAKAGFKRAQRFAYGLDDDHPRPGVRIARQSLRRGFVDLTVRCNEACTLSVTGRVTFHAGADVELREKATRIGRVRRIRIRLGRGQLRPSDLRQRRGPQRAVVRIEARDRAGNTSLTRRRIRVVP